MYCRNQARAPRRKRVRVLLVFLVVSFFRLLESHAHGGFGASSGTRTSIDKGSGPHPLIRPPNLARKSAPSSIVVEELQKELEQKELEKLQQQENMHKATKKLYSRDKWWKKFSSANLNDLTNEVEKDHGKDTYIPQFEVAGGDHYIKQEQ